VIPDETCSTASCLANIVAVDIAISRLKLETSDKKYINK